jgi:hypothetical protein
LRSGFKDKADHNKRESLASFWLVILATAATPLFVTLGAGFYTGKLIPSILSLSATVGTAWLQLRRPQQLWGLYRGCQREIEDQQTKYRFGVGEYESAEHPDKLLAEHVAAIALAAHHSWMAVIPSPEHLQSSGRPPQPSRPNLLPNFTDE